MKRHVVKNKLTGFLIPSLALLLTNCRLGRCGCVLCLLLRCHNMIGDAFRCSMPWKLGCDLVIQTGFHEESPKCIL